MIDGLTLITRMKWHPACVADFKIIAWPAATRKAVRDRDLGVCCDCSGDFRHWGEWAVDHHIPLWKVATLPPEQRIEYFRLPNLVTRCKDCHARKTAAEAAERAKIKRIARGGKVVRRPMRAGSRKIPSRPW